MSTQEHGSQLNNLIVGNRPIDDINGHYTVQHCIPSPVHRPLAASGYPFKDFVSAGSLEYAVFLRMPVS